MKSRLFAGAAWLTFTGRASQIGTDAEFLDQFDFHELTELIAHEIDDYLEPEDGDYLPETMVEQPLSML